MTQAVDLVQEAVVGPAAASWPQRSSRNVLRGFCWAGLSVTIFAGWFVVTRFSVTRELRLWDVTALRFGIGLYGISPLSAGDPHAGDLAGLRPVLSLKTTIIKTIELQKGDRVSYNGIFTAPHAMRLGVLPLGYYEGVPRELSSCGILTAADGQLLPIRGRVCMNHTMIDLGETSLQTGDVVTVMSADPAQPNSVARLVADHHLFPYTLLAGLSSSIRRNIV